MSEHSHQHRESSFRRLTWALVLATTYMFAEIVGGLISNSFALLADAGHMLTDVGALGLSLFAMAMARRPPADTRTYGYYRAEILAALANGATLIAISLYIFVEAYRRFRDPPEIASGLMMLVAVGGLLVNGAMLLILRRGQAESLNVRGAWLHVLGDALGSVGVIVAAGLIWAFGWNWADPVASVVIAILIVIASWRLLGEAVTVLMEGAPGHIDVDQVRSSIKDTAGVIGVHDLHVWTITTGFVALSAHVDVESHSATPNLLNELRRMLHEQFDIEHVTLQFESADSDNQCPPCVGER